MKHPTPKRRSRKEPDLEFLKRQIVGILRKHHITKAGIFGSYARGEAKKKSDIDIIIQPRKGMGFEFFGLQMELEEKLGKKVDLVTYKYIHPLIKEDVLNEEVRII